MVQTIATATRHSDGRAFYFTPGGQWAASVSEAEVARDPVAAARLLKRAGSLPVNAALGPAALVAALTAQSRAPQAPIARVALAA